MGESYYDDPIMRKRYKNVFTVTVCPYNMMKVRNSLSKAVSGLEAEKAALPSSTRVSQVFLLIKPHEPIKEHLCNKHPSFIYLG